MTDEEIVQQVRELAAELDALKRQYGDQKGVLVFLGHHPEDLEGLGGFLEDDQHDEGGEA